MFLTETRLDNNMGVAVLIETTPPNFKFSHVIRGGKQGGGVAALFKDSFLCNQTDS